MTELLIVLTVALVFLGPERIPGIARMLGKFMREARSAMRDIQTSLHVEEVRQNLKKQITIDDITDLIDGGETGDAGERSPPAEVSVKPAENVIAVGSVVAGKGDKEEVEEGEEVPEKKRSSESGQISINLFQDEDKEDSNVTESSSGEAG